MLNSQDSGSYSQHPKMLSQVKSQVQQFGDADLLNDFVFHNYCTSVTYFDDNFEKTALYLDLLSKSDNINTYIKRTQNYEMMSAQYLPSYAFKKFCGGHRAMAGRNEYPR
jgi:hypothetical protein